MAVSGHILYVCGALAFMGAPSPFARASDMEKVLAASEAAASASMQQELRIQMRLWCTTPDAEIRRVAEQRIDDLRLKLKEIANVETPEPRCEQPAR